MGVSGTYGVHLGGVLLCRSVGLALKGAPWVGVLLKMGASGSERATLSGDLVLRSACVTLKTAPWVVSYCVDRWV